VLGGLMLVLTAGILQGAFLLPSKWLRHWQWENYWLVFSISAYLVCPWILAVATVPDLWDVYRHVSWSSIVPVVLFGLGWGLGAVSFGLGVDALGLALGFAVILGVAATSGTVIPLLVSPPSNFSSAQAVVTGAALCLMLAGIAICSFAGRWKQQDSAAPGRFSYRLGLLACVASGLLSACGNLGYVWGEAIYLPLATSARASYFAPNALWPLLTPPLFLCNAGFALYRLQKNATFRRFRTAGSFSNYGWSLTMGVMWLAGMAIYGIGAQRLGALGKSLGWAIMMTSMILTANALGVLTGEWKAAPRQSKRDLGLGLLTLVAALALLGYANGFATDG